MVILSTHGGFYHGLHTWLEIKLNLYVFWNTLCICLYHMTPCLRVIYGHVLNLIICWFTYIYLVMLCNDVHNNVAYIIEMFSHQNCDFKVILMSYDKKNLTFILLYN